MNSSFAASLSPMLLLLLLLLLQLQLLQAQAELSGVGVGFIGCYKDTGARDLRHLLGSGKMTIDKCRTTCADKGFSYFGLQFGVQCFCGNSYGEHGNVGNAECSTNCSGNATQFCGNTWRNSVYHTGISIGFLGCYRDSSKKRDFAKLFPMSKPTIEDCRSECSNSGFRYFGLQFGSECWCGNSYGKYDKLSVAECSMKCSGDDTQLCGNNLANSVYTTGIGAGFIGCYTDTAARDLPHLLADGKMTVDKCRKTCGAKGYRYFGLQYGRQCWCGNSFGEYGQLSFDKCSTKCDGDDMQFCGNTWVNSVYHT